MLALRFIFEAIKLHELQVNPVLSFEDILENTSSFVTIFYHFLARYYPESPLIDVNDLKKRASASLQMAYDVIQVDSESMLQ